jgi:hypothetical protein
MVFPYLLVIAVVYNMPLILIGWFARKWLSRYVSRSVIALGFFLTTGYVVRRMEWFDVWRHGIPDLDLLIVYLAYMVGYGAVGWLVGVLVTGNSKSHKAPSR